MERIDALTEEFRSKYEKFLIACDSLEEIDEWNKEESGEMDVYYENELISVIIRLIAADGEISEDEADYLNKNFGFEYTIYELADIYECCRDEISEGFEERLRNGISFLRSVNEKLAQAYKELLKLICSIIMESDGVATDEELDEIGNIKSILDE